MLIIYLSKEAFDIKTGISHSYKLTFLTAKIETTQMCLVKSLNK